ncbi:DUF2177 family protein [Tissierella creatinophila]|uniref:DUF2177 domain-containing protein n=1 Tax=Tissierella creatinophila DSM 6911 TaxID=1123403 RepID=A0A1U7M6U3_TISCR|nr:DUF2177 family protein [Tissierella creatinophila]OLS03043.1 hypothetical protein TICRE_07390 [Tissierella creatinophila DSM 6911]
MEIIKHYIVTFLVFFAIDIVWLGIVAKKLYKENLSHLMADSTNWTAAIIFYALFIGGLIFFAINPALKKDSIIYAISIGALFGFMTYATYDMTNLATLKDWPLKITIIDIIWGTTLNALTAGISFYIIKLIDK